MKNKPQLRHEAYRPFRPTDEFADDQLVKAQSVRKRYSQTGSYFGVKPVKLSNGRLAWPSKEAE